VNASNQTAEPNRQDDDEQQRRSAPVIAAGLGLFLFLLVFALGQFAEILRATGGH
jgi:hypothetical protein